MLSQFGLSQSAEDKDKQFLLIFHQTAVRRKSNYGFQVGQILRFKTSEDSPEHHWTLCKLHCVFFLLFCAMREVNTRPLA